MHITVEHQNIGDEAEIWEAFRRKTGHTQKDRESASPRFPTATL